MTIILTTHYIEEAEAIADRVAVINKGEILLVEDKHALMRRLGRKTLRIELTEPIDAIPPALADYDLEAFRRRADAELQLRHRRHRTGITRLLQRLRRGHRAQ